MTENKAVIMTPNIFRVAYHGDMRCAWAYFDFDLDLYTLSIQSDCGNAAYRWSATPGSESFLHLMARCDEGYMFSKLFEPSVVDADMTVQAIAEYLDDEDYEDALADLRDILDQYSCASVDYTARLIDEWVGDNDVPFENAYEYIAVDYTRCEKRIIRIFEEYVKPKIKEWLEENKE